MASLFGCQGVIRKWKICDLQAGKESGGKEVSVAHQQEKTTMLNLSVVWPCGFYMIEIAKAVNYNQNFILQGFLPSPCAVYMYKIMILLNKFSSETTCLISTKLHVDPLLKQDRGFPQMVMLH